MRAVEIHKDALERATNLIKKERTLLSDDLLSASLLSILPEHLMSEDPTASTSTQVDRMIVWFRQNFTLSKKPAPAPLCSDALLEVVWSRKGPIRALTFLMALLVRYLTSSPYHVNHINLPEQTSFLRLALIN